MMLIELQKAVEILFKLGVDPRTEVRQDDGHFLLTGYGHERKFKVERGSEADKKLREAGLRPDLAGSWGFDTDDD